MVEEVVYLAYLFPGQGSQYVGMGKDLYENFLVARKIFEEADEILGFSLSELCFKGPLELLSKTKNCQLAVFVTSIACLEVYRQNFKMIPPARFVAGLSLGEYSALVASGALEFVEALKLVEKRASFMEEEAVKTPAKMLAVLGLDREVVERICKATQIQIANLNCPYQIVVSGRQSNISEAIPLFVKNGAKKIITLNVSGGFHSSLMIPAREKFKESLKTIKIYPPRIKVVSNVTADVQETPEQIRENLALQLTSPVRWEESMRFIYAQGVRRYIEIGPGKVLSGLLKKTFKDVEIDHLEDLQSLQSLKETLSLIRKV
jgi:[acyl-carrier-protein] S-malonyltransferase